MTRPTTVLPTFLIIGAQKCGTTALVHSLRQHPEVFIPGLKEAHFFGTVDDPTASAASYNAFFAAWGGEPHVGEATPNYLVLETAPAQISSYLPDVKLIVSLRNPVDRAYSAYWHAVREGECRGSFAEAISQQSRRFALGERWAGIVQDGRYLRYLRAYDRWFGRDRIHTILHDDLVAEPQRVMDGVAAFIGLRAPRLIPPPFKNTARRTWLPQFARRVASAPLSEMAGSHLDSIYPTGHAADDPRCTAGILPARQ